MNASVAFNDSIETYNSSQGYQDPTNIDKKDGAQYAPAVSGGGLIAPNMNAKWIARVSGSYRLPWQEIGIAGTLDMRQGYPRLPAINIPSRPNSAGAIAVLLDPVGDVRLPTFRYVNFRIDKKFTFGLVGVEPQFDIFNLFNASTILAQRENQNASNANRVANVLAPRVARIGVNVTF